jgi:hypothetical protein
MLATTARSGSLERPWSAKRSPQPPGPVGRPSTTSSSSAAWHASSGTSPTPPVRQRLIGLPTAFFAGSPAGPTPVALVGNVVPQFPKDTRGWYPGTDLASRRCRRDRCGRGRHVSSRSEGRGVSEQRHRLKYGAAPGGFNCPPCPTISISAGYTEAIQPEELRQSLLYKSLRVPLRTPSKDHSSATSIYASPSPGGSALQPSAASYPAKPPMPQAVLLQA